MSDETLRDLERRVKASPTDVALGHELVRALERGGESARATEELVRIARLGDRVARESLERLSAPRPNGRRMGHRRGVRDPAKGRWSSMRHEIDRLLVFRGASDEAIYLSGGSELWAYDTRTLARVWATAVTKGQAVIGLGACVHGAERSLEVLGERGERLHTWDLRGRCTHVDALGHRAAAVVPSAEGRRIVSVERESAGVLWERSLPHRVQGFALVPGRVLVTTEADARILDGTTGATLWKWRGDALLRLLAADAFGFAGTRDRCAVLLDRSGGSPFVFGETMDPLDAHVDLDHLLVSRRSVVELYDRTSHNRLWAVPHSGWRDGHPALAGAHVWGARVFAPGEIEVSALARENGRRVASCQDRFAVDRETELQLVPLDGAIVVVATNARSVLLLRLEEG